MPEFVKKSDPVFFSSSDEKELEVKLRKQLSGIRFVDGSLWESTTPPAKDQLTDCKSGIVFLWDQIACPKLPHQIIEQGKVRGPTSGVVIQFMRSREKDGVLVSGDMGIGYDKNDAPITAFVKQVWKVLKSMNAGSLESFDRRTGQAIKSGIQDYVVGPDAIERSRSGIPLKHCSADVYYRSQ